METQEEKTVEYRVRATLKKTGKELDEKNLLRLLETKLKNAEIFHLPSGVAEVVRVERIRLQKSHTQREGPRVPGKGMAPTVDLGDVGRPCRRKPNGPGEKAAPPVSE